MTATKALTATSHPIKECCMCGDLGLSYLLFRCKVCESRYQHKYCSNEYPAAKFYRECNWCLSEKDDSSPKTHNSVNSSSLRKSSTQDDDARSKRKNGGNGNHGGGENDKGSVKKMSTHPTTVKKRSPERLPPTLASRKRITTSSGRDTDEKSSGGDADEKARRLKSADMVSGGIVRKHVLRNKVIRKYKLLDEVSC